MEQLKMLALEKRFIQSTLYKSCLNEPLLIRSSNEQPAHSQQLQTRR